MTTGKSPVDISLARSRLQDLDGRIETCRRCSRLVEHREKIGREKRASYREWEYWAKPITGFGDLEAQVIILGLAPAAHGGNRTGRVFSGDSSANFLMRGLHQAGFANQPTSEHRDDGLVLRNAYLSAAVRCVPPGDKPTTQEQHDCLPFLVEELEILPRLTTVLALGHIAFRACLRALSQRAGHTVTAKFGHGTRHFLEDGLPDVVTCYHPSPRNTNTGRLTMESFVEVLQSVWDHTRATDHSNGPWP